ncbi:hypothetical protein GGR58DRAFT_503500 [Xylaria digitata]|nr:hypothetical protein GGR58DRAFT_503500 [Xylaria digitata]
MLSTLDSYPCAQGFNISNQQDIDASTSDILLCQNGLAESDATFINSHSPTTDLGFPQGVWAVNITISNIELWRTINASGVEEVGTLFLTQFYNGTLVLPAVPYYTDTVETVVWKNGRREVTFYYTVDVLGNQTSTWKQTNASSILNHFKVMDTLYMENSEVVLPACENITSLEVIGDIGGQTQLAVPVLNWVLANATFIGQTTPPKLSGLREFSTETSSGQWVDNVYEWNVVSIGNDFSISAISNVTITMPSLASVTNQLSINNSINSTFAFNQLTSVGSVLTEDNADSPLPGDFRNLEFASSIYLKGHIDTSSSGNLFPFLKLVQNSVTIEAWNPEFNCSKLVSQQRQGIIGHLYCNGTDNGNATTALVTPTPSGTPSAVSGLSRGAWAGIGVSVAVVVLGLIGLVTWVVVHFRSRIRSLEERGRHIADPAISEAKEMNLNEGGGQQGTSFPVEMNAHPEPRELDAPRVPIEADTITLPAEAP